MGGEQTRGTAPLLLGSRKLRKKTAKASQVLLQCDNYRNSLIT